jgi:hypothetical protein
MGARFDFSPSVWVRHRRRPFGPALLRQRFRLRAQSGRLFARHPQVYAANPGFWAALIFPFALLALLLLPCLLLPAAAGYCALTVGLSRRNWRERLWLLPVAPPAFFLHHLIYAAGVWWGTIAGLASRVRKPG